MPTDWANIITVIDSPLALAGLFVLAVTLLIWITNVHADRKEKRHQEQTERLFDKHTVAQKECSSQLISVVSENSKALTLVAEKVERNTSVVENLNNTVRNLVGSQNESGVGN